MNKRTLSLSFLSVLAILMLVAAGCSRGAEPPNPQQSSESTPAPASPAPAPTAAPADSPAAAPVTSHETAAPASAPAAASNAGIAGIEWTVPPTWKLQPDRPMRIATYSIPAASGDAEGGECAVFFFGAGQGGEVRSNINRWASQFETDKQPKESTRTINGIDVTTVAIEGTYLAPGGPMMQSQGKKSGYRLMGVIAGAPEGAVFFKATGPAATIAAAEKDMTDLVNSIRKAAH